MPVGLRDWGFGISKGLEGFVVEVEYKVEDFRVSASKTTTTKPLDTVKVAQGGTSNHNPQPRSVTKVRPYQHAELRKRSSFVVLGLIPSQNT